MRPLQVTALHSARQRMEGLLNSMFTDHKDDYLRKALTDLHGVNTQTVEVGDRPGWFAFVVV